MPRWIWFAPFGVLVVALAAWGFRLGWIAATITETDVIEAWVAHYVTLDEAAARNDCTAQPGRDDPVWIVVSCVHADGRRFDFPVDRLGRLIVDAGAEQTPDGPKT